VLGKLADSRRPCQAGPKPPAFTHERGVSCRLIMVSTVSRSGWREASRAAGRNLALLRKIALNLVAADRSRQTSVW